MDIVKQKQVREWILLSLVGGMALVANLPHGLLETLGINLQLVMAILGLIVVLALFLYVRFFFFLLYTLLAIGANLPEKWADGLGIAQGPLLATLVSMVVLSLINYGVKLLPSGLDRPPPKPNPEATQVLLNAIERGNLKYIKAVLSMEFDVNGVDAQGISPLMRAAQKGNLEVVDLLLAKGASPRLAGPLGTPVQIALNASQPAVAERLHQAEADEAAKLAALQRPPTLETSRL